MTEKDAEELLEQSKQQKRHTSEPTGGGETSASLESEIAAVYDALEAGDVPSNLTMRDENLAALVRGLENADRLDAVGADLREHLNREPADSENRGSVLKLLARAGLQAARPDLLDAGKAGYEQHQQNQDIEF